MPSIDAGAAVATVTRTLDAAIDTHRRVRGLDLTAVATAAVTIAHALASGRKVLAFGNGGSAGDAQHLVTELVGRFQMERAGYAAIALTRTRACSRASPTTTGSRVCSRARSRPSGWRGMSR